MTCADWLDHPDPYSHQVTSPIFQFGMYAAKNATNFGYPAEATAQPQHLAQDGGRCAGATRDHDA